MDPSILLNVDNQAIVYYTLYGEIELDNTTAIALELANRAYREDISFLYGPTIL